MTEAKSVPRLMGVYLVVIGIFMYVPSLAIIQMFVIPDLWDIVTEQTNWSVVMIGWSFAGLIICSVLIAIGCEVIWYYDRHSED